MARVEYHGANGFISVFELGLWSPGFRQESKPESVRRIKPKVLWENPTNLGTHSRQSLTIVPQSWVVNDGFGGTIHYINCDPRDLATVGLLGFSPYPDWQTKLRLAIKDQKVNLAQTLAEYPQAQRMFVSNATTIAKVLRSLRRGDLPSAQKALGLPRKRIPGTISNRWLELQYGWKPLLQDLHGSVEELQAALSRPRTRHVEVRAVAEEEQEFQGYYVPHHKKHAVIKAYAKTVVKVSVYLRQESLAASRLGITNPINLAWELLPYSFVIDWFIPIGNWLNSLDAGIGFQGLIGTVTTKHKYIATNWYGSQHYLYQTYGRSVIVDIPDAPLPTWKPSLNWTRVANALALLSQLKR